ncbi:MAG: hypothetical protein J0I64_21270, partial [Devosia sp.]|nr:hypothetical protein [Devosia sp.]
RQPSMVQTDLIEFLEAEKAAEAAKAAADAPCVLTAGTLPPSETSAPSSTGKPEQGSAKDEDIKFFKEVAHIRKEESPKPAYDYRFLLRPIQQMLTPEEGRGPAVCACGHARGKTVNVHLIDRENGTQRASAVGIYRCGNGEACPVCARHVAALRAKRYRLVHEAVNAMGGTMLTFVFTIDHAPEAALAPLLAALKSASTGARSDRFWNEKIAPLIKAVGAMTDAHVRRSGRGGWHPHLHVTLPCLTSDMEALRSGAAMLIERFVERLAKLGYRASLDLQSMTVLDARPNAYPAHHHRRAEVDGDLADEIDDDTSLSPFDIAELAAAGNVEMKALFVEFVEAMRGSKSGVITAAMAKKLGIEAGTDPGPGFDETTRLGSIPSTVWMKLLDLNLTGTFLTHVETFGREGWRRSRWWALEQTNEAPEYSVELAAEIAELIHAQQRMCDPIAKELAQDQIEIFKGDWTWTHGAELVAGTMDYVAANHRHMRVDTEGVDIWVSILEESAGQLARRRSYAEVSHTTLPVGDGPPPAKTVSHGSDPDHVRQNMPVSPHI